ncbi:MAG: hypothetical protein U5L76_00695 [Patescibacteria group bacterium]|nr:hypothetical protein [Patescibacteria group bacterium]
MITSITALHLKEKITDAGKNWHHHCLPKTCFKNKTGQDIILLEVENGVYYCESDRALKKELEEMAFQQAKGDNYKEGEVEHKALDLVKDYTKKKTKWHFHICYPDCYLNDTDKFLLILENDENKEMKKWEFKEKPVALARAIDDYYLGRKK